MGVGDEFAIEIPDVHPHPVEALAHGVIDVPAREEVRFRATGALLEQPADRDARVERAHAAQLVVAERGDDHPLPETERRDPLEQEPRDRLLGILDLDVIVQPGSEALEELIERCESGAREALLDAGVLVVEPASDVRAAQGVGRMVADAAGQIGLLIQGGVEKTWGSLTTAPSG